MKMILNLRGVAGVGIIGLAVGLQAQEFRNIGIAITSQGTVIVQYEANNSSYYILYSGDTLDSITRPIQLALGQVGEGQFTNALPTGKTMQFYRVGRVGLAQPLDTDKDGIDDVFELGKAGQLNPLDRGDAFGDSDEDGMSNWAEYRFGTDPSVSNSIPTITTGSHHSLLLKTNGSLWSWGDNFIGQLGDGSTENKSSPIGMFVGGYDGAFVHIAAGDLHTMVVDNTGTLRGWGDTDSGQLGGGAAPSCKRISAGGALTLVLSLDGSLWGAGVISFTPPLALLEWVRIDAANDWKEVAVGGQYACNHYSSCPPVVCQAITHSMGLKTGGTLWGWGENEFGQLGNGRTNEESAPVQIGTGTNWVAVTAGERHTVALRRDGSLWSWGWNVYGQLGDGTTTNGIFPGRIGNDNDWAVVSAGYRHTVALKADGSLWAWGCNDSGQFGDGTTVSASSPVRIGADRDWVALAAGAGHTLGLKTDGSVWAWGNNQFGQVGDGTTEERLTPVRIISANE